MKDRIGSEIKVGDIILSSANTAGGYFRIGKVTKLYDDGSPCIKTATKKWNNKTSKYEPAWYLGRAGTNLLVLADSGGNWARPWPLSEAVYADYDAPTPPKEIR